MESAQQQPAQSTTADNAKCPVDHTQFQKPSEETKCPVDPSAYQHFLPKDHQQQQQSSDTAEKCPVDHTTYKHFLPQQQESSKKADADGCDSDAIDARNNMPSVAQQTPVPGQKMPLGVEREISTIPRADVEEQKWIYPSEQMFFNAMRRKNWNPEERDMSVVVPIHNAVNEMAWMKILEWEKMHQTECNQPKLVKFQGRPKEITPKARLWSWFGGYQDPRRPESISFYLDVRPAVSFGGVWDRMRMSFRKGEFI
ncbi:cytochrome c/c1 heme-lyase [Zychaea mexicana]|uniref:cytochrome c/c1 heme-lyase n=1 Tax=Zychaea mexicana TaxID=64656 RepID=UPI0022FF1B8C|nr:cytochrome c/c1 heme-lyase [Zychaea mexicana]KAI9496266.1 cytochrome c/c1 heme-lyase [Zychaea mexicana]